MYNTMAVDQDRCSFMKQWPRPITLFSSWILNLYGNFWPSGSEGLFNAAPDRSIIGMMSQIDPDRLHFGRHGHKRLVGQKMNDLANSCIPESRETDYSASCFPWLNVWMKISHQLWDNSAMSKRKKKSNLCTLFTFCLTSGFHWLLVKCACKCVISC